LPERLGDFRVVHTRFSRWASGSNLTLGALFLRQR
jgi:hypothetical protein